MQIGCMVTLKGHTAASQTENESKDRGVFLCEYIPLSNPYKINDTIVLHIKNVWIEKHWRYGSRWNDTYTYDGYQLIIETEEKDLIGYDWNWYIGVNTNAYIRECGKKCLISDFEKIPDDTLKWQVQNKRNLIDSRPKIIIGEFILRKK